MGDLAVGSPSNASAGAAQKTPAQQNPADAAVSHIRELMKDGGWGEDNLTNGELKDIKSTLENLSPADANKALAQLTDQELKTIADEIDSGGLGNYDGLSKSEKGSMVGNLAGKLDAKQFERLAVAFNDPQEIADIVAAHGTTDAKIGFINAYDEKAEGGPQIGGVLDSIAGVTKYGNEPARAIGSVLASMAGDQNGLKRALGDNGVLSSKELQNVLDASMNKTSYSYRGSLPSYGFSAGGLNSILDAVATSRDASIKANVFSGASQSLGKVQEVNGNILTPAPGAGKEAKAIAEHMAKLLQSDTRGIVSQLEAKDPTGKGMVGWTRQMLADGNTAQLKSVLEELRGGPNKDPKNYLKDPEVAEDLGYMLGSIKAGLTSLQKSSKENADLLGKILGFGISRVPGGVSDLISFASDKVIEETLAKVADGTTDAPRALYTLMVDGLPAGIQSVVDSSMGRVINQN